MTFKTLSLFFLILGIASASQAAGPDQKSKLDQLALNAYWLKLGHYEKGIFGGWKSQVDGGEFFFSAKGATNPRAEIEATLEAFSKDIRVGKLKQHPQCAFPERFRFLTQELGLSIPKVDCPAYKEFISRFNAKSATLVFSSAYPNNPGSMFGHTFLRINSKNPGDQKKLDLLDQGVSYAALVGEDEGGVKFAVYGLAGGYWGQFSVLPYYVKVNEYSNAESRDIWEYDLALNDIETNRLLTHAWELETNALFRYYFFDENCAYVLLKLLEIAKPEWNLSYFPIYVIPGETIKKVAVVPHAVTNVRFRPSLRKRMFRKYDHLDGAQKSALLSLVNGQTEPVQVESVPVLEAASSYLLYMKAKEGKNFSVEEHRRLRSVLIRRSQLGVVESTDADNFDPSDRFEGGSRPDLAHDTYKFGISGGIQSRTSRGATPRFFQELEVKSAFHDLMNNDLGYTAFSQMDFPGFTLRNVQGGQGLSVEHFQGLQIISLFPFNFLEKSKSWKINLDYHSPKDYGCTDCHLFRFNGGAGITLETLGRKAVLYSLVLANFEGGDSLRTGYRLGPQLEVAILYNPFSPWKLRAGWRFQTDLFQDDRQKVVNLLEAEQSYSFSKTWEMRVSYSQILGTARQNLGYREGKVTFNAYF